MNDALRSLNLTIWKTAGSRYNAARRLTLRDTFSTASQALFAVITIGLTIVQKVYFISDSPADKFGTVLGVFLGAFLLAVSLLEAGRGNALRADELHRNAEDLTALTRGIDIRLAAHLTGNLLGQGEVERFAIEYEQIKSRCTTNHSPRDYRLFLGEKRSAKELAIDGKPPMSTAAYLRVIFAWYVSTVWYFIVLWLVIGSLCVENWLLFRG
ncbi:hypothetical protein ABH945_007014 [Paraburkholderia sp. GAS333]|uniref:SLATT domain-containing protein n=1 Tax=Paraburkholderia sp. GAS333 TaxID=3156279 RepID=UPI003D1BB610